MGNEKKWSIGQDAKKGDILVLENDRTKWIFRFDGGCEYIGHHAYRDMLIDTKGKPTILDKGKGVAFIRDEENVRLANDDEKKLFFQSFDEKRMKDADLVKNGFMDWLDKEEEYHRENAHNFGCDYSNGFIAALQIVREKLGKIHNV